MLLTGDASEHRISTPFESRRKQAMAIVMMGVLGAEFGQEMEPSKRKGHEDTKKKNVVDGFGLTNYSHARHTSKSRRDQNSPLFQWYYRLCSSGITAFVPVVLPPLFQWYCRLCSSGIAAFVPVVLPPLFQWYCRLCSSGITAFVPVAVTFSGEFRVALN